MAQKTFVDNDVLTASDINTYLSHEGGAWTAYTATVSQGVSTNISKITNYSNYARAGRMITWTFHLVLSASGTAGSGVSITLPVAAVNSSGVVGAGIILDNSTGTRYTGSWVGISTSTIMLVSDATGNNVWGAVPSIAVATADQLQGSITYEAAS